MSESPEFVTGESDPADFTVDQVTAHLDANPGDATRVQDLEAAEGAKNRLGIANWEAPEAEPTVVDPQSGDVVEAGSDDAPKVGDEWTEEDGYTRRIVSVD